MPFGKTRYFGDLAADDPGELAERDATDDMLTQSFLGRSSMRQNGADMPPPGSMQLGNTEYFGDLGAAQEQHAHAERQRETNQLIADTFAHKPGAQAPNAPPPAKPTAAMSGDDEVLHRQWRDAERSALAKANPGAREDYGLGEFVRDNGAGILAGLLDMGMSGGKNVAGIVGQTLSASQNAENARRAEQKQAADFAQTAQAARQRWAQNENESAYKSLLIDNAQARIATANTNAETAQGRQARLDAEVRRKHDVETAESKRKADVLIANGVPREQVEGRSSEELDKLMSVYGKRVDLENMPEKNKLAAQGAGMSAAASERGRTGVEIALKPQVTQSEIEAEAAKRPGKAETAGAVSAASTTASTAAKAEAEKTAGGQRAMANVEVVDDDVYRGLDATQFRAANALAGARATFDQAMSRMATIRKRQGSQTLDSKDKSAYDTAHGVAIAQLSHLYNTGVINEAEFARMKARIPGSEPGKADVQGAVQGKDVVFEQITGAHDEVSGAFDAGLSQYGVKGRAYNAGAPDRKRPGARAPAPAGKKTQTYAGMSATKNADGTLSITTKDGRTKTAPASFAQQFIDGGGALQ